MQRKTVKTVKRLTSRSNALIDEAVQLARKAEQSTSDSERTAFREAAAKLIGEAEKISGLASDLVETR